MLALKKKREAEAKAKAEAEASGAASTQPSSAPSSAGESTSSDNKVSLLGIGGKKKSKENGNGAKKRTPGEIRIQKGEFFVWCCLYMTSDRSQAEQVSIIHTLDKFTDSVPSKSPL